MRVGSTQKHASTGMAGGRAAWPRMTDPWALWGKQGSARDGLPLECPGGGGVAGIELEMTTVSNGDAHNNDPTMVRVAPAHPPRPPSSRWFISNMTATIRVKGMG